MLPLLSLLLLLIHKCYVALYCILNINLNFSYKTQYCSTVVVICIARESENVQRVFFSVCALCHHSVCLCLYILANAIRIYFPYRCTLARTMCIMRIGQNISTYATKTIICTVHCQARVVGLLNKMRGTTMVCRRQCSVCACLHWRVSSTTKQQQPVYTFDEFGTWDVKLRDTQIGCRNFRS